MTDGLNKRDSMHVHIEATPEAMGAAADRAGTGTIRNALAAREEAFIVVATGTSQFEVLKALVREPGIAWDNVTAFRLDEYLGTPVTHPASILQTHAGCQLFLDNASASSLEHSYGA